MSAATLDGRPPLDAFTVVDTAVNGAWNRNRVMALADFHPPPHARDVFATYCRFTLELFDYAATNPLVAPHKRPSVTGYRGPTVAAFLPADCDDVADPDRARADAIRIVRTLEAHHDVPPAAVRIFFSGCKGFSLEIPGGLFGGFAPAADLPARFKRLVFDLFGDCPTFDPSIYESLRLWRRPNSRHGKSGLFKIRLSLGELEGFNIDAIRALATSPRLFPDDPLDDDWLPRARLVDAWTATARLQNDQTRDAAGWGVVEGSRPLTPERQRAVIALMARHWHAGQKHTVALGLAGWLALTGVPEQQGLVLFQTLSSDDWRLDDRLRCLRDSYQRQRLGLSVAGPSRLREHLPSQDMVALGRLLHDDRPNLIRLLPSVRGRRLILDLSTAETCHAG